MIRDRWEHPPAEHPELTDEGRVGIKGRPLPPDALLRRALYEPGLFTRRIPLIPGFDHEPLHRWQARAALVAFDMAGYVVVRGEQDAPAPGQKDAPA